MSGQTDSREQLAELYRAVVLRHNRAPNGRGPLPGADVEVIGENPLCGERLVLRWCEREGRIAPIRYEAEASALAIASASILVQAASGKTRDELAALLQSALDVLRTPNQIPEMIQRTPEWDDWLALRVVLDYPNRIKALTLPWVTLRAGLAGRLRASTDLHPMGEEPP